uniref:BTB domain-containing protein n=1 Tax=Strigamia maritima TaxID=126957 RepID=T1J076_STRMM
MAIGIWSNVKVLMEYLKKNRHLFELFLIYHIDYDCWSVISLPDIDYQVKSYVSYDGDCLLFEEIQADDEDSTGIYKCNMYSLKKRMKVAEYQSENVYDFFYFDANPPANEVDNQLRVLLSNLYMLRDNGNVECKDGGGGFFSINFVNHLRVDHLRVDHLRVDQMRLFSKDGRINAHNKLAGSENISAYYSILVASRIKLDLPNQRLEQCQIDYLSIEEAIVEAITYKKKMTCKITCRLESGKVFKGCNKMESQQQLILSTLYTTRDVGNLDKVVLECNDGLINAHKTVLIAGSDYFRVVFNPDSIENETNVVTLQDTSIEVMDIVIKFIYAQDIPIQPEMPASLICDLVFTADKMQLKGLFDKFWSIYTTPITLESFKKVWQLANIFNQTKTINILQNFILKNVKQISKANKLCDITETQLASFIDNLGTNNFGDFIILLLNWGKEKKIDYLTWEKEQKIEDVLLNLIPNKCDLQKISDFSLQNLLSSKVVVQTASLYNVLNKEAISRWLKTIKQEVEIFAFEVKAQKCEHRVFSLNQLVWSPTVEHVDLHDDPDNFYSAVSRRGNIFYFSPLPNNSGIEAIEGSTGKNFSLFDEVLFDNFMSETANSTEVFFRQTDTSFSCFNLDLKTWRKLEFNDQINDCRWMILATEDGKYYFEVNNHRIKIIDTKLGTCVRKINDHGNLLIYDIAFDCWYTMSLPNVQFRLTLCVSCEDDYLLFEKSDTDLHNVYSLKTKMKVTQYTYSEDFDGFIYFDAKYPYFLDVLYDELQTNAPLREKELN